MQPFVTPRALETAEIAGMVDDYPPRRRQRQAAGFDGVELHGANGYLVDQFLRDSTNQRTDRYGGSAENRARFLIEVTEAMVGEWGGERVGVRLSPTNPFNDIADSNPAATFAAAVGELKRFGLAYLHIVEPLPNDPVAAGERPDMKFFRRIWRGTLIGNKGYDFARANAAMRDGTVDLVSFATLFLANPDLPERFRRGAPFNAPDRPTFYGGRRQGYTDYPALRRRASSRRRRRVWIIPELHFSLAIAKETVISILKRKAKNCDPGHFAAGSAAVNVEQDQQGS